MCVMFARWRSAAYSGLIGEIDTLAVGERTALRGRMRVATSVAFGRRVVTPLLLGFVREHPEIEIEMRCDDSYIAVVAEGIDVSIRLGRLADSTLATRTLGFNPWVMVASPFYLARRGRPTVAEDLARHDVLVYSSVHGDDHLHLTDPARGRVTMRVRGPFRSSDLSSVLAAARDGLGLAALPLYVAGASLATGQVERVLADHGLPGHETHAVSPSPKLVPARVGAFVGYLKVHFARPDWCSSDGWRGGE